MCLPRVATIAQRHTGRESLVTHVGVINQVVGLIGAHKDAFDPCGFALFSDERGVVFEEQPTTLLTSPRPEPPNEIPSGQDERTPAR